MQGNSAKRTLRAIVAEESPAMRRWYAAALTRVAGEIEECDSGWQLLNRLAEDRPCDLVVASKWLPGIGGAQILAILRAAGARVPFVLVAPFCDAGVRALVHKVPDAALVEDALDATRLAEAASRVTSRDRGDRPVRVAELIRTAMRHAARVAVVLLAIGLAACDGVDGGGEGDAIDDGDLAAEVGDLDQPPLTGGLATLAGSAFAGDVDGARTRALFDDPVNVVVGGDGRVLVADHRNDAIRRVDRDGDVLTASGAPREGRFVRPFGMCLVDDTLYVQTDGDRTGAANGALWRIDPDDGTPELVLDGAGLVRGMAALPDGRIALADHRAHVLRIFDPDRGSVTLLAGAEDRPGFQDGTGDGARFNMPYDLAVTARGELLVSDAGNNRIRRVTLAGEVTTWAGTGAAGAANGDRAEASFRAPQGLAMTEDGTLYVADAGNFVVRRISTGGAVTTIAGDGAPGFADSEDPLGGELFGLQGIDAGGGALYIADGDRGETGPYHRVRRLTID